MVGLRGLMGLGLGVAPRAGSGAGPIPIPAPFASVDGPGAYEGGFVEYASLPTLTDEVPFTVSREGFDATGGATTYLDTFYVVKTTSPGGAVRQPYPNQALQLANKAALSDYIYSTDTPSGSVTNNSTLTSPKSVANWATPDRRLVGDTIGGDTVPVEVVVFHRNARVGKQIACVVFTISDGVNPAVTATVTAPEKSVYPGDLHTVIVYKLPATSISGLNTGSITVDAKAYPWIGAAASVLDSTASVVRREFSTRYFYRDAAKFAAPDIMYVATTGNDSTAEVNNPSLPAATVIGAVNRMRTGSTGAPWNTATTKIMVKDNGTFVLGAFASGVSTGQAAGLLVTRDTATTTQAGVILTTGASSCFPNISAATGPATSAFVLKDVSINRSTGALNVFRGQDTEFHLDQVAFDCSALTSNWFSGSSTNQLLVMSGVTITNNGSGGSWGAITAAKQGLWRGVSVTSPGTTEAHLHLGCDINIGTSALAPASGQTQDGLILAFSRYYGINHTSGWFSITTACPNGFAVVQNVVEYIKGGTVIHALGVSHDSQSNNVTHPITHNNTYVGAYEAGRWNVFYDEGATARTNKLQSVVGNIIVAFYIKGDVFVTNGARLGNVGPTYGVGMRGNFTMYRSNSALGGVEAPAFEGRESNWGTSASVRNDPLFTDYQGTTGTTGSYVAGAGNGDYSVSALSPCKGLLTDAVLPFDFAGTARSLTADTAGAYAAP